MKTKPSIRGRIFAPVFYTIDAALGIVVVTVVGVYALRRYAEYKIMGSWNKRVSPRYPNKENTNGKSYRVSRNSPPFRGNSSFTGTVVESGSPDERY
mgnify:CR=1 FL=1